MPNVRRIILTNHWLPTLARLGEWSFVDRFFDEPELPDGVRFGGPLSRDHLSFAPIPPGLPLYIEYPESDGIQIDHGFKAMCRALSIANIPVETLSVDYDTGIRGRLPSGLCASSFHLSPRALEHCCNVFRHLRRPAFSLWTAGTDEKDIVLQGNPAKMLTAAEGLEELSFDFTQSLNDIPLKICLGTHIWPRLRTLQLSQEGMHQHELVKLLQRHCKTCKVVRLSSIVLQSGTWVDAAEDMRRWLALEKVSFRGLFEWRVDEIRRPIPGRLERYILHGESDPIYGSPKVNGR